MFVTKIKLIFLKIQDYAMCKKYYFSFNLISFIKNINTTFKNKKS